jgi:hypothetical protein
MIKELSSIRIYRGCPKNVLVFKRFFLQPYIHLCRNSVIRNIIIESGISGIKCNFLYAFGEFNLNPDINRFRIYISVLF